MIPYTYEELIKMIATRDGISYNEARDCCDTCRAEILDIVDHGGNLELIEETLADYCGLEPDYLELML